MKSSDKDPKDYTLVPKKQFDNLLKGVEELNKSVQFLLKEREMLLEINAKLETAGNALVAESRKMMEKFKELQKENERLALALAQRIPRKKSGEGKN
jgi:hypothetical protein